VYGVEPSTKMRAQAVASAMHPAVSYQAGSAEEIPLPDASCDSAVLFYVWHHVIDRPAAVAELHRVVRPGGKLFVRTNLSDPMPDVWWFRLVPEWLEVDRRMYRHRHRLQRTSRRQGGTLWPSTRLSGCDPKT